MMEDCSVIVSRPGLTGEISSPVKLLMFIHIRYMCTLSNFIFLNSFWLFCVNFTGFYYHIAFFAEIVDAIEVIGK